MFDAPSNMSGIYNGVQARFLLKQPLTHYIHCAAHRVNLVCQAVANTSGIRNALGFFVLKASSLIYLTRAGGRELEYFVSGSTVKCCPCETRQTSTDIIICAVHLLTVLYEITSKNHLFNQIDTFYIFHIFY